MERRCAPGGYGSLYCLPPAGAIARARIKRLCRTRAPQPRLPEERIHGVRAGVRRCSAQSSKWQVGKTPRNRRCEALKKLALAFIKIT
jgi:hypothetical protein